MRPLLRTGACFLLVMCMVCLAAAQPPVRPKLKTLHSAEAGNENGATMPVYGYGSVGVYNTADSGWDGTLNYEATIDGTNWVVVQCREVDDGSLVTTTAAAANAVICGVNGMQQFRARISGRTAGTTTVTAVSVGQVGSVSGGANLLTSGSDGDSTTTQSDSGLELISGALTLLRGCADDEILKWDETEDDWNCETDAGAAGGDSISIDSVPVTDPDFQSTADIDFIDTTNVVTADINADVVDFDVIKQDNTLAGNPALLVDECFLVATTIGGGLLCEGSTANTNEQLYLLPDVDGADTTNRYVVNANQTTDIEGAGLSVSAGTLDVDHDAANNFAADEHTDHTSVTLTAGAGLSGGGDISANRSFATDSTEADFLANGALVCGGGTQGKAQVHTTPLQYCDNAGTPVLRYSAYAASDGDALAGDSATSFFDAGTIEHERGGLEADVSVFSNGLFGTDGVNTIDVDTEGELETALGGINVLLETEIDASSELAAIMDDETGTGALVFGTSPTIATPITTGKVDRNNVAVNDDSCVGEQGLWWYDTTDSQFEFCNANSGAPVALPSTAGDITDIFDCATGDCNAVTIEDGDSLSLAVNGINQASAVLESAYNDSGVQIEACTAVYISGFDVGSDLPEISIADADNAAAMPALGITIAAIANGTTGLVIMEGILVGVDTDTGEAWSVGDAIYVDTSGTSASADCGENMTSTAPTGESGLVQAIGRIARVNASDGHIVIQGAGRSNETSNLDSAAIFVGNSSNQAVAVDVTGDVLISNTGVTTIQANSVALTTDTTGNYADGDAEGGSALTGDTATAFFASGTIEHERGGLEADVSAVTGLLAISGGTTSEVDAKSELETQIADVSDFAEADGDTWTGVHDFSGATSIEVPNSATPTTDAFGEIAGDSNAWTRGALQSYDGTASVYLVGTLTTDAPTNGQVPKWNTGGTITWENDSTGSGSLGTNLSSTTDDIVSDNGTILLGGTGGTNNETLDFDFETTANTVSVSTTSGVTAVNFGTIELQEGGNAVLTTGDTVVKSIFWSAGAMSTDATECSDPAEATINSGPKQFTIACPMGTSETDGFVYGTGVVLPDGFDQTADVTFELTAYLTTDSGAGTWHGEIAIQCQSEGEIIDSTWGTGIGLDLTPIAGDVVNDVIQDTSAAVDTDTTGEDCDAGDILFWRWKS